MDTDYNPREAARSLYKEIQDRFALPDWQGYHDTHTLSRLYAHLGLLIEQAGGDSSFLDESGQASHAEMNAAVETLFENYYLKYVELSMPNLDSEHVTDARDGMYAESLKGQLKGLSDLRTAFEKSGKAAAHIDPVKFKTHLADTETRFRQEAATLSL